MHRLKNYAFFSKKLPSGALQLAVIISFIVILLCSFFISYLFLTSKIVDREQLLIRKLHNTNSFINKTLLSLSVQSKSDVTWYNEQDSIDYTIKNWGAYKLITAEVQGAISVQQAFILGIEPDTLVSLYLVNDDEYLAVSGNTKIKGISYLPRLGIRPKMIGNIGFSGKLDTIAKSTKELPKIHSEFEEQLVSLYSLLENIETSNIEIGDSLTNSFFKETQVLYNPTRLPNYMRGNIIIVDESRLELTSRHNCKDVILVAPVIYVRSGFHGNVQLFATDSIIIEPNTFLEQPSFLALYRESMDRQEQAPRIWIKRNAKICGGIFFKAPRFYKHYPRISVEKGAECVGNIYSENFVENKGSICGTVYTNAFYANFTRGMYKNCVMDAQFAPIQSYLNFVSPIFIDENFKWKKIKKLY